MITTSTDRRHPSKPNSHRLDEQGARHHPTAPLVGDHGTADGDHDVGRGVDTEPTGTWSGVSPTGHHHVRGVHLTEPFTRLPALRFGRWTAFDDPGTRKSEADRPLRWSSSTTSPTSSHSQLPRGARARSESGAPLAGARRVRVCDL